MLLFDKISIWCVEYKEAAQEVWYHMLVCDKLPVWKDVSQELVKRIRQYKLRMLENFFWE